VGIRESMIPADVLKFPGGVPKGIPSVDPRNRLVSLHFAAVNACHSEGRYRISRVRTAHKGHARGRKSAPPFLRIRHPFSPDDSPLRAERGGEGLDSMRRARRRKDEEGRRKDARLCATISYNIEWISCPRARGEGKGRDGGGNRWGP